MLGPHVRHPEGDAEATSTCPNMLAAGDYLQQVHNEVIMYLESDFDQNGISSSPCMRDVSCKRKFKYSGPPLQRPLSRETIPQ